jgi:hypothetical protein
MENVRARANLRHADGGSEGVLRPIGIREIASQQDFSAQEIKVRDHKAPSGLTRDRQPLVDQPQRAVRTTHCRLKLSKQPIEP